LTGAEARNAVLRDLLSRSSQDGAATNPDQIIDLRDRHITDLGAQQDSEVGDEQIIDLRDEVPGLATGAYTRWGKRVLDIVLVVVLLPFWGLLYAVIALALYAAQGRPIHYRSTRVGVGGRELTIFKFRTMTTSADAELGALLAVHPALAQEFRQAVKLRCDPRVTRLGRLLRQASLDELPQLLNVIRGDMSLIGPRPVLWTELDELYGVHAAAVLLFRPGLTGLWQVSGRSLLSYEERVALDLRYTQECGLLADLGILLRTVPCVLRGDGAF
jgi:lipopolysaccharide/colanic/teichoic acid biosynthesis glycosyltransferase